MNTQMVLWLGWILYVGHAIFCKTHLAMGCPRMENISFMNGVIRFKVANIMTCEYVI
jgi:hypothetical protein